MDSIHFYQSLNKTRGPDKRRLAASSFETRNFSKESDNPVVFRSSSSLSGRLEDYDLIKYFDLTTSPLEVSFLSPAPVLDSKNAESHTEGASRRL